MRLRFTIRDLLWLTALAALAVGWWLDHRRTMSRLEDANRQLQSQIRLITDKVARQPNLFLKTDSPAASPNPDQ